MSIIRADSIKNRGGNGAPDFPKGLTVTGVITATTLNQNTSGDLNVGSNIKFGSASGIATATTFVGNLTGAATQLATNATGANLTLSGNLGVGGTITYEDVARVDATGISTFREGFGVGPLAGIALTAYTDGSVRTSGIVTAANFHGGGANLTGLTAGQIPNLAASKITSGTVATARLGSGTANSGTYLRGDQSWAALSTNNAVRKVHAVYYSNTSSSFNGQAGTALSGSTHYPASARIGGSFTKISGTSKLLVQGVLTYAMNSTNIHGFCVWIGGDESNYVNTGGDTRQWYFYTTRSGNICVWPFSYIFNTAYSAGTVNAYAAPAVNGNRSHTGELNPDPNSNIVNNCSDTPNKDCHSCLTVIEFEP
tara:strand:- start:1829 stop:2932 length:1104 start_codon:yes stop_codon:yes gene_type:complete